MGKRTLIFLFVVALTVAFLLSDSKPAQSKENVIELSCSDFFPPEHHIARGLAAWAKEIEKRTTGRVKITLYHSGTLTSATACYEGVVRNLSDIGHSCLTYTRGHFPLMEVADLPGYPFNAIVPSRVTYDLYLKFRPKELSDTHVLYLHAHIPGGIFTRDKQVRSLEDLKGLRIRSTGLSSKIVTALGATPIAMPKGDQYDALYRGIVDGTTAPPNELTAFKVAEVTKYLTMYSPAGYVTAFFVVMNLKKWNSLPQDIQKVFTDVSEEWVEYTGKVHNDAEIDGIQYGKKVNYTFITLSREEGARWDKAIEPLFNEYVKAMEAKGLPGREALEYRRQLIEKYGKMYPPLKFD